jgi:hypothetical protein
MCSNPAIIESYLDSNFTTRRSKSVKDFLDSSARFAAVAALVAALLAVLIASFNSLSKFVMRKVILLVPSEPLVDARNLTFLSNSWIIPEI